MREISFDEVQIISGGAEPPWSLLALTTGLGICMGGTLGIAFAPVTGGASIIICGLLGGLVGYVLPYLFYFEG